MKIITSAIAACTFMIACGTTSKQSSISNDARASSQQILAHCTTSIEGNDLLINFFINQHGGFYAELGAVNGDLESIRELNDCSSRPYGAVNRTSCSGGNAAESYSSTIYTNASTGEVSGSIERVTDGGISSAILLCSLNNINNE
ncbi:MAG: hypothetical protein AB7T49_21435 [Oligoflexales bacterium]